MSLIAALWALLNILLHFPNIIAALSYVNSFFDFGMAMPVVAALFVALVAGVIAFVQHRRGTARTESTGGERRTFAAITVVVVGLMALFGILHLVALSSVSASEKADAITVEMKNTEFNPTELQVPAGQPVKFVVKNRDLGVHTFTIKELGIDFTIVGRSEKLIEFSSTGAGTFEYICEIPGHDDMKGTIVVQ